MLLGNLRNQTTGRRPEQPKHIAVPEDVGLVEKEHHLDVLEKGGGGEEEEDAESLVHAVGGGVLFQNLVVAAQGGEKQDASHVVE